MGERDQPQGEPDLLLQRPGNRNAGRVEPVPAPGRGEQHAGDSLLASGSFGDPAAGGRIRSHADPPPCGERPCKSYGPCLVSQRHRAERTAELAAVVSDVIPANGPDGQLARLPRRHAVPVLWEPSADLLAAPRRGPILVTSRDVSPHVLSEAIRLLQHGLAGSVAVADAGVSQRPGQTIASAGSELRPVMTPLRAPNFYSADGARCRSRDTPAGKQAPLPGGQRPERGKEMSR